MGCIEDYSKPVCYFYIDSDGKIAYVGKANGTIVSRIKCHAKEEKFIDCHCEFDIRYQVFDKASDMDVAEKVYIKSLKPYLNVVDATTGFFPEVNIDVLSLEKYVPGLKPKKKIEWSTSEQDVLPIKDPHIDEQQVLEKYIKDLLDETFSSARCRQGLYVYEYPKNRKCKIILANWCRWIHRNKYCLYLFWDAWSPRTYDGNARRKIVIDPSCTQRKNFETLLKEIKIDFLVENITVKDFLEQGQMWDAMSKRIREIDDEYGEQRREQRRKRGA